MNCRSRPTASAGAVAAAAAEAVAGRSRPAAAPFRFHDAYAAAETVWPETNLPREIAVAGIVYDMMPGHLSPRRAYVARRLRIDPETVPAMLALWEMVEPAVRFDAVRRAVSVARTRRLGG